MTHTNTGEIPKRQLRQNDVKCRFFAQYLGQEVIMAKNADKPQLIERIWYDYLPKDSYLLLKEISKITDKDCILIFNKFFPDAIRYSDAEKIYNIKSYIKSNFLEDVIIDEDFIFYTDFMRSKGYAMPFMGYSVSNLVDFGWVRLS